MPTYLHNLQTQNNLLKHYTTMTSAPNDGAAMYAYYDATVQLLNDPARYAIDVANKHIVHIVHIDENYYELLKWIKKVQTHFPKNWTEMTRDEKTKAKIWIAVTHEQNRNKCPGFGFPWSFDQTNMDKISSLVHLTEQQIVDEMTRHMDLFLHQKQQAAFVVEFRQIGRFLNARARATIPSMVATHQSLQDPQISELLEWIVKVQTQFPKDCGDMDNQEQKNVMSFVGKKQYLFSLGYANSIYNIVQLDDMDDVVDKTIRLHKYAIDSNGRSISPSQRIDWNTLSQPNDYESVIY